MNERILGTQVPDHAIHRASMWLEDLKYGDRRATATLEQITDFVFRAFVDETGLPVTVEQLKEAAGYYGLNMLRTTVGTKIDFLVDTDAGLLDARAIFASLWLDAFMHGAATVAGKHGLSNTERARAANTPPDAAAAAEPATRSRCFELPVDQLDWLADSARREHTSQVALIREALRDLQTKHEAHR